MAWTLYKRGRIWWAVQSVKGVRERKSTEKSDRRAAELVVAGWERREADPRHRAAHETTLESALKRMIADREVVRQRAAGTVHMYGVKAAHLKRLLGGETVLADIGAPEVDTYVEMRLAEGAARSTIGKELTALRATLKIAKRRGEFDKDVADVMPIGWSNDYKPRKTFLTPDELALLLDDVSRDHTKLGKPMDRLDRAGHVAFICATGMRLSEAARAERCDVNEQAWTVYVRGTKTDAAEDTIAVSPFGRELLTGALKVAPGGKSGPLFARWPNMRRDLATACRRVFGEKGKRVSANDLRRTCSSWLVQNGASLFSVAKVLRHRDTRMVERVYGQLGGADLRATLERETAGAAVSVAWQTPTLSAHSTDSPDASISCRSRETEMISCPGTESNRRHGDFQAHSNDSAPSAIAVVFGRARGLCVSVVCPGLATPSIARDFGHILDEAVALGAVS